MIHGSEHERPKDKLPPKQQPGSVWSNEQQLE